MDARGTVATGTDVEAGRRTLVVLPALTCLLAGGFMVFAGVLNLLGDQRAGYRYGALGMGLWGALLVLVGVLAVSAGVSLSRGRRSGWVLGLIALPLIAALDVAFSVVRDQLPVGPFAVVAVIAWAVLALPRVRSAFAANP